MSEIFKPTFAYKLIYIFQVPGSKLHEGLLKIGDAKINTSLSVDQLSNNCKELNQAAMRRIKKYITTSGLTPKLMHTELAIYRDVNGKLYAFRDHKVHRVLENSGVKKQKLGNSREWFKLGFEDAKKAITAVKNNQNNLGYLPVDNFIPIAFRPEQEAAIKETVKKFKTGNKMLWNAKMRFGKTLCALQVVKEMGFKKTIIVTHRPVVNVGWYEDFNKIFHDDLKDYEYGSRQVGSPLSKLLESGKNIVYFASIEDLRGSGEVGGQYDKNKDVFDTVWDFVIVDEAHEGTQTSLGDTTIQAVLKEKSGYNTKFLALSGTPFNIIENFDGNIYTWDYIMEQEAKIKWDIEHCGDSNPYDDLPKMNIYTYDLGKLLFSDAYEELEDKAFNFREFFRVWSGDEKTDKAKMPSNAEVGDFIHAEDVNKFLNLITKEDGNNHFPFAKIEYRELFKHTLWIVPGQAAGKALSKALNKHSVFGSGAFDIVNVAGEGDEDINPQHALATVKDAIHKAGDDGYTITLSCGRLTTGVTVPEWTAVFMLAGSYSTAAARYLQTIFRVQSPGNVTGKMKENCYVFDFAPDRTLKMISEAASISRKAGGSTDGDRAILNSFLNYCPVISLNGTEMKEYDANLMLQQLKKAYAERAVRNGFEDTCIYSDELFQLSESAVEELNNLGKKIGKTKQKGKIKEIPVNDQGFTDKEKEKLSDILKKKKKELSEEEKALLKKAAEQREKRKNAILILRGISIRMPLMIYGANINIDQDFTIDMFLDKKVVDDLSWEEFMPEGITRDDFKKFIKYYDPEIFVAAGKRIRNIAKSADELLPKERVQKLTDLFSGFRNPDKETVLTPWSVVNMHMGSSLGGYSFFDEEYIKKVAEPYFIDKGQVTRDTFANVDAKILEINSKSGLYPLYAAYSIFRKKCSKFDQDSLTEEIQNKLWAETVENNIFVICKTPMAKQITTRTLVGNKNIKVNAHAYDDLLNQLRNKQDTFVKNVKKTWLPGSKDINFDAVIGNPPYQGTNHQQVYPDFYLVSQKLGEYVSLIFPTGWQKPANANNLKKLNNPQVKKDKRIIFIDNRQNVFPGISGAEWVNILLWNRQHDNNLTGKQLVYTNGKYPSEKEILWESSQVSKPKEILAISSIVTERRDFVSLSTITSARKPYGLHTDITADYAKYGMLPFNDTQQKDTDIKIYGKSGEIFWVDREYKLPKKSKAFEKYKVFVPYAWGNMCENNGLLGGAYSDIIVAKPYEICTETYLESGCFENIDLACKHAKYLMTQFARALLYKNKTSQHSTTAWGAVPIQDYSEDWWKNDIETIEYNLAIKYKLSDTLQDFIKSRIQKKSEGNILNYK